MINSVAVLEFHEVSKTYHSRRGDVCALNGMSFRLEAGAIHVLLGPNGAENYLWKWLSGCAVPTPGTFAPSDSTRWSTAKNCTGGFHSSHRK